MKVYVYVLLTLLLLSSCGDDTVTGGTDVEVGGTIAGVVTGSDGVGTVSVILVPSNYKPGIDADSLKRTTMLVEGAYSFTNVSEGHYNLLFRNETEEWAAFKSVGQVDNVDSIVVETLTLEKSGTLTLLLSEVNISGSGTVSLIGSDLSFDVTNGSDTVILDGVPGNTFDEIIFEGDTIKWEMEEIVVTSGKMTTIPYNKRVLFINDGNTDSTNDYSMYTRFKALFKDAQLVAIDQFDSSMVDSMHAVVLLPSVETVKDTLYWKHVGKPLMVCSHVLWKPLAMVEDSDTGVGTTTSGSVAYAEDQYHPILDTLYTAQQALRILTYDDETFNYPTVGWGRPAETGRVVLKFKGNGPMSPLFTYEQSAKLADESVLTASRLGIFSMDRYDNTSEVGWWLYQRSLYWVTGIIPAY